MRCRASWLVAGAMAVCPGPAFGQAAEGVPFELSGYKIVARGTIENSREVRMLIDTGASCSVIARRLAEELKLQKMALKTPVNIHGRKYQQSYVLVRDIRLGPITTSRTCIAADIPLPGVEMIVGLDVLRRRNLTIDLEAGRLLFVPASAVGNELPFNPDSPQIILSALLGSREIRLMLDTGAEMLCLYGGRAKGRLPVASSKPAVEMTGIAGNRNGSEVYLRDLVIGRDRWDSHKFLIVRDSGPALDAEASVDASWDGVLAPGPLGIKQIYIDFTQGLVRLHR